MDGQSEERSAMVDRLAEWIITLVALGIMIAAFVAAQSWPTNAAMFPLALSGFAIVLLLVKIVGMVAAKALLPPVSEAVSDTDAEATQDPALNDLEEPAPAAFETAGRSAWFEALSCILIFFVLLTLVGIVAALVVFGIGYLKLIAKKSLLFAAIYVGALMGAVHLLFVELLSLPLPSGILFS